MGKNKKKTLQPSHPFLNLHKESIITNVWRQGTFSCAYNSNGSMPNISVGYFAKGLGRHPFHTVLAYTDMGYRGQPLVYDPKISPKQREDEEYMNGYWNRKIRSEYGAALAQLLAVKLVAQEQKRKIPFFITQDQVVEDRGESSRDNEVELVLPEDAPPQPFTYYHSLAEELGFPHKSASEGIEHILRVIIPPNGFRAENWMKKA